MKRKKKQNDNKFTRKKKHTFIASSLAWRSISLRNAPGSSSSKKKKAKKKKKLKWNPPDVPAPWH